ncbi:MAG: DNA adenine methylase [Bellilinea sp.]
MHTNSPLRYPGGKFAIRTLIKQHIDRNGPISIFVEPFAGGAGISLWLLLNNYVKKVLINDFDFLIYRIWDAILNNTTSFITAIVECPITLDEWHKQKEIIEDEDGYNKRTSLEIAFAAFFLNRCNRSGIITKEAGPIGGKNQTGKWKLDARFNKDGLIKKIKLIADHREDIYLTNYDAIVFLDKLTVPPAETFLYLDPPYYSIGKELYRNYFNDNDHIKLHDYILGKTNYKWLISYDNNQFIREIYWDQNIQEISINHQANIHHSEREIIITPIKKSVSKLVFR